MSRYRLYPTPTQNLILITHCAHARFLWNLALEQFNCWRPGRKSAPNLAQQCCELTAARLENQWLSLGSRIVQTQALRDFEVAKKNFFNKTHGYPTWRKVRVHEGFRIVDKIRIKRLNKKWGSVYIPKAGYVKFRLSRPIPEAKSFRVTLDKSGRWHIAFAAIPNSIEGPQDGSIIGIDRGITKTLALSDGVVYQAPEPKSVKRLQRQLSRCKSGSNRRKKVRQRLVKLYAKNSDRRKDWVEKTSTEIAKNYDLIRIEDLKIKNMTKSAKGSKENPGRNVKAKSGLNRAILEQGWGLLGTRLEFKAQGRFEKINPAFTSQCCSDCGHISRESRENQALFNCINCGYTDNADVNAAKNIAGGHSVTARRGLEVVNSPPKREPETKELVKI